MGAVTTSLPLARRAADDTAVRIGRHALVLAVAFVFVAPGVFVVWRTLISIPLPIVAGILARMLVGLTARNGGGE